ncbi:MAG: hypothetical protein M1436_07880, partial [Acidobacteria bacterium]|nr:hypothetical protein [Acidobacteriota bacterium]
MEQHVRILGILHIVWGGLGLAAALAMLAIFGGAASLIGISGHPAEPAIPVLGFIGGAIFLFIAVLSLPGIIAGIGLLKFRNWARILTIVLSAIELFSFPFGTALGIYGLWVLLSSGTERL